MHPSKSGKFDFKVKKKIVDKFLTCTGYVLSLSQQTNLLKTERFSLVFSFRMQNYEFSGLKDDFSFT